MIPFMRRAIQFSHRDETKAQRAAVRKRCNSAEDVVAHVATCGKCAWPLQTVSDELKSYAQFDFD